MTDSGDPKQDRQREIEAEREHYRDLPDNKLDDILEELYYQGYDQTGTRLEDVSKAKAAITQLLLEARINELERYLNEDGWKRNNVQIIKDRIAELNQMV